MTWEQVWQRMDEQRATVASGNGEQDERIALSAEGDEWVKEKGPRGGDRYRNTKTGDTSSEARPELRPV